MFQPVPPLVRVRSLELLDVIKEAVKKAEAYQSSNQPETKDIEMNVDEMKEQVRVVGPGTQVAKMELWDRLRREFIWFWLVVLHADFDSDTALSTNIATSSSLFGSVPPAGPSIAASYSTHKSSLLGYSYYSSVCIIKYYDFQLLTNI